MGRKAFFTLWFISSARTRSEMLKNRQEFRDGLRAISFGHQWVKVYTF